jgi:hypothetical protein
LANRKEFNTTTVALAESDVSFSTMLNGTYMNKAAAQAVASTILYVRVLVPTQQSEVVFAKLIPGIPSFVDISAEAVAGQLSQTKTCNGLGPFSPTRRDIPPFCSSNPSDPNYSAACGAGTDPNMGFVIGTYYTLRQPGTGNLNQAQDICADRGINGTTGNFGLADPAGCGTDTPCYRDTIVNGSNGNCVELGNDLPTVTGNKGINVQNGLQDRFAQDCIQDGPGNGEPAYDYDSYKSATIALEESDNPPTNCGLWRRVIPVAVSDGTIPQGQGTYNVVGISMFLYAVPSIGPAALVEYLSPVYREL